VWQSGEVCLPVSSLVIMFVIVHGLPVHLPAVMTPFVTVNVQGPPGDPLLGSGQ